MKTIGTIFALLFVLQGAAAQPNLNFKRVTLNWPTIELYFSVGCSGNPAYNMAKRDFKIFENGVEVKDFTLWCPDPTVRCAISVSLVFDASGSMSGSGNAGAKAAGRAFIDLMDGALDEATIIWFNSQVNIAQQMTTLKSLLRSAVDGLPASGGTAIWDGCYAGIIELINQGINQCRAVIVMADGGDNSSTRTPAEIISLANRNSIRVFTIGLGSSIDATELEMIALLTGGRYYQTPNSGQLSSIYHEITTIIFQGFQECAITYQRDCADGGMRTVELQLVNFCGGTDVKTKTYRAPLDSTTFSDLHMKLDDVTVPAGTNIKEFPLNLVTPMNDAMFFPFSFTLRFDPQCMQFVNVTTPPNALLNGVPLTVTSVPGGVRIETTDRVLINGTGPLLEFTFLASDPEDTTCCSIEAIDASFAQGCLNPKIAPGEVCILPRLPVITCDLDAPRELTWQRAIKDYLPNPFPVTGRFFNTGVREAKNTRFKISYNATDLQLVSPVSDEQNGVPPDIAPGNSSEVTWQLAAMRRTSGDSTEVCITAMSDNHEDVTCCKKIYIPATDPILECELDVPAIVPDSRNGRYQPMPFPVTVTVTNDGGMRTDSVFATIIVPPDLRLAGADAPDNHTKRLLPPLLTAQQSGSAQWMVEHPPTPTAKQYTIQVWIKSANADSTRCEVMLTIPALTPPFDFSLDSTGSRSFCEGDSVTLLAPAGYVSYMWSTGDTLRTLVVRTSGSYHCTVRSADGKVGHSDTVRVDVYPLPPKPVIERNGDVLSSDPAAAYQWLRDGQSIPGATQQTHVAIETGSYRVRVANEFGCTNMSDEFPVTVLGIEDAATPESPLIDVYPDPAHDAVTVVVDLPHAMTAEVWLVDALGRSECLRSASGNPQRVKATVDLSGRSRGLYHILVLGSEKLHVRKFMVY